MSSSTIHITPIKIIIPVILGLGVIAYLFYGEFSTLHLSNFQLSSQVVLYLFLAFFMMIIRDSGYMWRLRILSLKQLSWRKIFNIIFLWEFTSAITPSAVGGTSLAVVYIHKEGIGLGKSSAIVLATAFLDELYFILVFPLLFVAVGYNSLFEIIPDNMSEGWFVNRYFYFAVSGYVLKLIFIAFVVYGLFINPSSIHRLLLKITQLPFLKRWHAKADKIGNHLVESSTILKHKGIGFWGQAFLASIISWTARYLVVNFLLLALYASIDSGNVLSFSGHILLLARQLVMWIMMLVLPSPGGSGFAEWIFSDYLSNLIPMGYVGLLALAWRIITYYPYLIIGALLIPQWTLSRFGKKTILKSK